jgi:hypothetical protein
VGAEGGIGVKGICENATHVGDRLVDRRDLLERRIEWRRLGDQGREHVRIVRRECKNCCERELAADDVDQGVFL